MSAIGLLEDAGQAVSLNEHRYQRSQWTYQRRYPVSTGLRPNLQLEPTLRTPVLPCQRNSLCALADRLAGRLGSPFEVPTLSVAETQAEKVLSFLRRFAQHRSGQMQQAWDTALVRHIYDVHCIFAHHPDPDPELVEAGAPAFAALVQGDVLEFGRQQADFADDPVGVLEAALARVGTDEQSRAEYEQNLLSLVYGGFKPHDDEAFASFEAVARSFLGTAGQAR